MRAARPWWFVAITLAIGGLLLTLAPDGPRIHPAEAGHHRFDEPGAAARHDLLRRQPPDAGPDMPARYEAASRRFERLERFASRINRVLPAAQPPARVWVSGSLVVPTFERSGAAGILDAWTPLGPGNIGGRTRVVRFHPTVHSTLFAAGVSGGIWKSDDNGTTWRAETVVRIHARQGRLADQRQVKLAVGS